MDCVESPHFYIPTKQIKKSTSSSNVFQIPGADLIPLTSTWPPVFLKAPPKAIGETLGAWASLQPHDLSPVKPKFCVGSKDLPEKKTQKIFINIFGGKFPFQTIGDDDDWWLRITVFCLFFRDRMMRWFVMSCNNKFVSCNLKMGCAFCCGI